MRIAVVAETRAGETRVALVPESIPQLTQIGYSVAVQAGAGRGALASDAAYAAAGAEIADDLATTIEGADLVVSVQPLNRETVRRLASGTTTISFLPATEELAHVVDLRNLALTAFSLELVPRISRAQPMDALSSQSMVAGYRAAVVAAGLLRRFVPMTMTAASTVQPAQVVVLGAGVAGLQAIATSKRLGAVVKAYDVRPNSAEEIASVGAAPIDLGLDALSGPGGYAREMSQDRASKQRELLTPYVAAADALITTAAVPGREAPMLVSANMVREMKPGSVVVDLAAESGGNVEGSQAGGVVRIGNAQVWGGANVAAQMPEPASQLYSQNLVNLIALMTTSAAADHGATFAPDFDDEIVAGACVTHGGAIRHEPARALLEGDPA